MGDSGEDMQQRNRTPVAAIRTGTSWHALYPVRRRRRYLLFPVDEGERRRQGGGGGRVHVVRVPWTQQEVSAEPQGHVRELGEADLPVLAYPQRLVQYVQDMADCKQRSVVQIGNSTSCFSCYSNKQKVTTREPGRILMLTANCPGFNESKYSQVLIKGWQFFLRREPVFTTFGTVYLKLGCFYPKSV